MVTEVAERPEVSGDAEMLNVPEQLPPQCCPLLANWFIPMLPTPVSDALERAAKAIRSGLLLHHPKFLAGVGPVVSEA